MKSDEAMCGKCHKKFDRSTAKHGLCPPCGGELDAWESSGPKKGPRQGKEGLGTLRDAKRRPRRGDADSP